MFYKEFIRRQTLLLERTGIKKRDKFLRRDNPAPLIGFEVKQVCITGDEVVSLWLRLHRPEIYYLFVSTLLCDGCLPLGEHTDVTQLVHIAGALRRRCMGKGDDIVAADDLAYLR